MRGNRKSDLLGDSASRRSSREDAAGQFRSRNDDSLFDEEYRGSGRYEPTAPEPAAKEFPAEPENPPVKKRRSYDEALAASESARLAPAPEEDEEDMFDPLPLRFHPQTEGFIPEARAERERLKGRTAEPAGNRNDYDDGPAFDEAEDEEMRLPAVQGRRRPAYEEEEERPVPPLPRREREASYDNGRYDDDYDPRKNDRRRERYALGYPNDEVKYAFIESLAPSYLHDTNGNGIDIFTFDDYIESGKLDGIRDIFISLFARLPYSADDTPKERDFQNVIYIVFTLLGKYVHVELHSAKGRADCVVETENFIYIFEFKRDASAGEGAEAGGDRRDGDGVVPGTEGVFGFPDPGEPDRSKAQHPDLPGYRCL